VAEAFCPVLVRSTPWVPQSRMRRPGPWPAHHRRAHPIRSCSRSRVPGGDYMTSLKDAGGGAMLVSMGMFPGGRAPGVPPPEPRARHPRPLERGRAPLEELPPWFGSRWGKVMRPGTHAGEPRGEAGQVEAAAASARRCAPNPVLTRRRNGRRAVARPASLSSRAHHLVVEHHREPRGPPAEPSGVRLCPGQDVLKVSRMSSARPRHRRLRLSDLPWHVMPMAPPASGLSDGRDLVRLMWREQRIADAVPGEMRLHPAGCCLPMMSREWSRRACRSPFTALMRTRSVDGRI